MFLIFIIINNSFLLNNHSFSSQQVTLVVYSLNFQLHSASIAIQSLNFLLHAASIIVHGRSL